MKAVHSPKDRNVKINADGSIEKTLFLDVLELKVGARVMLINNVNTIDGLVNGAQGYVQEILTSGSEKKVKYVLVKFDDPKIGDEQKRKFKFLQNITKNIATAVPIESVNFSYTLGDVNKKHGASASFQQFPLKCSWALTSHKCQGQTIAPPINILADLNETFQSAMAYVILSRIVKISQLYLKPFDPKKIYCSEAAKEEANKIKMNSLTKFKYKWDDEDFIKVTSINIRSLNKHSDDLENDFYVNKSDIICVNETWLTEDLVGKFQNYPHQYYLNKHTEGIALLSKNKPNSVEKFHNVMSSIIAARFDKFNLITVYRFAKNQNITNFKDQLLKDTSNYFDTNIVICGDFNLDLIDNPKNIFTKTLLNLGFRHLVTGPTHILGGQIDHVYFRLKDTSISIDLNKLHEIYYSDHSAITFFINQI